MERTPNNARGQSGTDSRWRVVWTSGKEDIHDLACCLPEVGGRELRCSQPRSMATELRGPLTARPCMGGRRARTLRARGVVVLAE